MINKEAVFESSAIMMESRCLLAMLLHKIRHVTMRLRLSLITQLQCKCFQQFREPVGDVPQLLLRELLCIE